MVKKQSLVSLFICFFGLFSMHAAFEEQSATFYNCNAEIILDSNSLQKIFNFVIRQLDQQTTGSVCINYTESGYTLLQALQKGGFVNITIENEEKKAYLTFLIKKSASQTQKKSIPAIFKSIKKALGALSLTTQ